MALLEMFPNLSPSKSESMACRPALRLDRKYAQSNINQITYFIYTFEGKVRYCEGFSLGALASTSFESRSQ